MSEEKAVKKIKIEISSWWTGKILFSGEYTNQRECVEDAVRKETDLHRASLDGASLDRARLDGARLVGASLVGASLDGASLDGARLVGASLVGASLVGASLVGASLDGASLDGARLVGARGLERFPIQIGGHKHWLITTQDGRLQIGCHVHAFDEWRRHAEKIGKAEGYTALDVEMYKLHIEHIEKISRLLWNQEKAEKAAS
jgi:hypothetical protein